jgi:spore coat protein CotH/Leucine-rich repeat (LRR) protein
MKKVLVTLIITFLITFMSACIFENPQVVFEDENFEFIVRDMVNKSEEDIYASDVRDILELDLSGLGIHDLSGIEHFTSLEILNLEDNKVEDLTPLKSLLDLTWLSLRNNQITSLDDVGFDQLSHLNLSYLSLRHNVVDISDDQEIRLSDISLLSSFTSLQTLELRDNHISDISVLSDLVNLIYLDISQNPIEDKNFQALENLNGLEYLNLRETDARNLDVLSDMNQLEYLNIHSNTHLDSIEFVSELTKLRTLIAQDVIIGQDIIYLANLTNLMTLNLQNTGISNLDTIKNLMMQDALQDKASVNLEAEVNISQNPILEEEYEQLEPYWDNISIKLPFILPSQPVLTPLINEIMASNGQSIEDFDKENSDWIELYNPTDEPFDLSGYYLSDDSDDLSKWSFPDQTIISANGYLLVFASNSDQKKIFDELHTNFSLDKDGEDIFLVDPDGQSIVDYIPGQAIPRNYSYGRINDGDSNFGYFDIYNVSPASTNNNKDLYPGTPDETSISIETFDRFFDDEKSKSIIIQISQEEWDAYDQAMLDYADQFYGELRTGYYAKADLLYTDEQGELLIENIGFRTRGNMSRVRIQNDDGSLNMSNFKISFHETFDSLDYVDNGSRTVFGVEELDMKWNRNYDPAYVTEKYSLDLMKDFGVYAAEATLAKVYIEIEGERHFYGVYTVFEPIDELFIKRRFSGQAAEGDLYKSLWQQYGPASLRDDYPSNAIGIKDLDINYRPTYDLKTNKSDFDPTNLEDFITNVSQLSGDDFKTYIENHFEVDRFIRYMAVGVLLGNPDDYRAMANNYYLYHNPLTNKWTLIAYDYDHGMGQGWAGEPIFSNWTIDQDIYDWGDLNAHLQGQNYSNPLSDKILKIEEYQLLYEEYLTMLINPDNDLFSFSEFSSLHYSQKALYETDLSQAKMSLEFGLRNVEWYISEKIQAVEDDLDEYQTYPERRPSF